LSDEVPGVVAVPLGEAAVVGRVGYGHDTRPVGGCRARRRAAPGRVEVRRPWRVVVDLTPLPRGVVRELSDSAWDWAASDRLHKHSSLVSSPR
jgi:hypothetical protein